MIQKLTLQINIQSRVSNLLMDFFGQLLSQEGERFTYWDHKKQRSIPVSAAVGAHGKL